jgi:hypothetical protein
VPESLPWRKPTHGPEASEDLLPNRTRREVPLPAGIHRLGRSPLGVDVRGRGSGIDRRGSGSCCLQT